MHPVVETVFERCSKHPLGEVLGATVIGAILPFTIHTNNGHMDGNAKLTFSIAFAVGGFMVGLGLVGRDYATKQIVLRQEAGCSARGWIVARALILLAMIVGGLSGLLFTGLMFM